MTDTSDPPVEKQTGTVKFLLDGEEVHLVHPAPTTTVLTWLREQAGRCGTKEGCAEGDCGACTVVLAEPAADGSRLRLRALNACLSLLPMLHGKALFTVESLRAPDGRLHPVQQAMVDCHGAQCGFCTPGFVMSLYALYRSGAAPEPGEITDALSGNLCRCTGYRPILDAARRMEELREGGAMGAAENAAEDANNALLARLLALQDMHTLDIGDDHARLLAPATLHEFARLRAAHPQATVLAGCTDIGIWLNKQLRQLPLLLWLGRVNELARINEDGGCLEIGAAVSLEDAFAVLRRHYPESEEFARRFASRPIRNAGTLCGNIANASPVGDAMPALIALGARLLLRQGDDKRELALEDFYLDYRRTALRAGEFVQAVRIPLRTPPAPGERFHFRAWKVARRHDQDIAAVFGGFALQLIDGVVRDARLAFGGMAATPRRAHTAEQALRGRAFDGAALHDAQAALAEDFRPLDDLRASRAYRMRVAQNLLARLQLELDEAALTRVTDPRLLDASV
jgi:xanthine dehydrogenase small subunit